MNSTAGANGSGFNLRIIGERINPGFRTTRAMFDTEDLAAIQALAVRQVQAGAAFLNVNVGARAQTDERFVSRVIRAIQDVVEVPLCFDFPHPEVQRVCLQTYDAARAAGQLPIVNSITEHRWALMELYGAHRFQIVVMASERMVDGVALPNKNAADIAATARRAALRLRNEYGMPMQDILIDVSVSAVAADTEGLSRATIDAIAAIGSDPDLTGIHIMGGLSNIGQQLPAKAADGSDLKLCLENAFLTIAVPLGFDTVLGTPWRGYAPLSADHHVMKTYQEFLQRSGTDALRAVRRLYRA